MKLKCADMSVTCLIYGCRLFGLITYLQPGLSYCACEHSMQNVISVFCYSYLLHLIRILMVSLKVKPTGGCITDNSYHLLGGWDLKVTGRKC